MTPSLQGTLLILTSAFFYGSYGIWSRLMLGHFGEFSQAWTRGLLLVVVTCLYGLITRSFKRPHKSDLIWFIAIGLAGGLNQAPYFYGFEHLSIGTATLFFYASLVIGGYILGKIFFSETLTRRKLSSLILALSGMAIIYGFSLSPDQIVPAIATIISGLLGAAAVVFTKKLSCDYSEFQIMSSYFIAQVLINTPLAIILHDPLPAITYASAWLLQLGYAVSMLLANSAVIKGFKYLEPSVGSILGTSEVIFGFAFGALLFSETLTIHTAAGAFLILLATLTPHLNLHSRQSIKT